jgi:hypothetical protein
LRDTLPAKTLRDLNRSLRRPTEGKGARDGAVRRRRRGWRSKQDVCDGTPNPSLSVNLSQWSLFQNPGGSGGHRAPRRGRYGGGAPVVGVGRDRGPAAGGGCPLPNFQKASFGTASADKFFRLRDTLPAKTLGDSNRSLRRPTGGIGLKSAAPGMAPYGLAKLRNAPCRPNTATPARHRGSS